MKAFKYKLDGLLKLRKFEEDKVKFELGQINIEIQRCDEELAKLKNDVDEGFKIQENLLASGTSAYHIKYLPDFLVAKNNHLDQLNNYKENLLVQRESILKRLQEAHQKFKVLSKMKDKDQAAFNKNYMKKLEQDIEEVNRLKKKEGHRV